MKKPFSTSMNFPSDVACVVEGNVIACTHKGQTFRRGLFLQGLTFDLKGHELTISMKKANKKDIAKIRSFIAHLKNACAGFGNKFVYEMEICNVHFPMTVKLEGTRLIISNFLGEKEKRIALVAPNSAVEIKGQKLFISSTDIEAAGQTAANIERATHIPKRDRRVFQDGIFIVSKGGNA